MISRRNYIVITMMFLILFFMFQFSVVMKQRLNEYGTNQYEDAAKSRFTEKDMYHALSAESVEDIPSDRDYVVYIGDTADDTGQVITWWCSYTKRAFLSFPSLETWDITEEHLPEALVVKGDSLNLETDGPVLQDLAEQGIHLIFAGLPDSRELINHEELWELFGIRTIMSDNVSLAGMHLFGGFLLGGEAIYEAESEEEEKRQDLVLEVPWYVTGEGTKTYLVGILEDESIKDEELPAMIWRHSTGTAMVFCVNGDYLSNISGIGILEAMMSETYSYDIYPVVNAQNLVMVNYPGFADENQEVLMERYSQAQTALFIEVVWPDIVSMLTQTGNRLTCMMTPQFDYSDGNEPDTDSAVYFLRMLQEEYGEAGLSGGTVSSLSLRAKLQRDNMFWRNIVPDYSFLSFYLPDVSEAGQITASEYLPKLRTVVTDYEPDEKPVISYLDNNITLQRATSSGSEYTYSDDFYTKSMETALGYSNIVLDMMNIVFPDSEEDSWEKVSKKITANVATYWKPFEAFSATVLSESDQRIRRFLALDYSETREDHVIDLKISNFEGKAWFLLRTHDEYIREITGGTYEKIEDGAYLIEAESSHVEIELEEKKLYFYEEKG